MAAIIVKKGGEIINYESRKWIANYSEVKVGTVAVTGPGNLLG